MKQTCSVSVCLIITILEFLKIAQAVEYIFPQNQSPVYYSGRPVLNKIQQSQPSLDYYSQQWDFQHQEQLKREESGHKESHHDSSLAEVTHYGPPVETGHEHHSLMTEMKKLGFEGVSKIVLAVSPFVICLVFVPLLIITVGTLLIPVIRIERYKHEEERAFGSKGIGKKEEISHGVMSSLMVNEKYNYKSKF